ncbi:MAG: c-type cytochrome [Candidatus Acidiferrales bacterium]
MTPDKPAEGKAKFPSRSQVLGIFVIFVIVAVAGGIMVYALSDWSAPQQARQMPNPVPGTPQTIAAGMSVYMDRCQNCHGEYGNGKGSRADKLSVQPSDFTDAHAMSTQTDGELFWKISEGHKPMPSFKKKLSEEERWQLVDFIRTFSQGAGAAPAPAASSTASPAKAAAAN